MTDNLPDVFDDLYQVIVSRQGADPESSWTAKLFAKGPSRIAQKVGEEATETIIAYVEKNRAKTISESADLLYHLFVLWAEAGITPDEVRAELAKRSGISGIEEKRSRSK